MPLDTLKNKIKKDSDLGFWKKHSELLDELFQDENAVTMFRIFFFKKEKSAAQHLYQELSEKGKKAFDTSCLFNERIVSEMDRIRKEHKASSFYDFLKDNTVLDHENKPLVVTDSASSLLAFEKMGQMLEKTNGFWVNETNQPQKDTTWEKQEFFDSRIYTNIADSLSITFPATDNAPSAEFSKLAETVHKIPKEMKKLEGKSQDSFRAGMKTISDEFSKVSGDYIKLHNKDSKITEKTAASMNIIGRINFLMDYSQKAETLDNRASSYFKDYNQYLRDRSEVFKAVKKTTPKMSMETAVQIVTDPETVKAAAKELKTPEVKKAVENTNVTIKKSPRKFQSSLYTAIVHSIAINVHDHTEPGFGDTNYKEYTDLARAIVAIPYQMKNLENGTEAQFREGMEKFRPGFQKTATAFIKKMENTPNPTEHDKTMMDFVGRLNFIFDFIKTAPVLENNAGSYFKAFRSFLDKREQLEQSSPASEKLKIMTDPSVTLSNSASNKTKQAPEVKTPQISPISV